jgi:hypothetical protein
MRRALLPDFPLSFEARCWTNARQWMNKMKYDGPVAVSVDDTKLQPALRTYWDAAKGGHVLVGAVDYPVLVPDDEALLHVIKTAVKAAKVCSRISAITFILNRLQIRVFMLVIPLTGTPPLILAARAIPSTLDAEQLYLYTKVVLTGLHEQNIHVVSYGSDGAATERAVQHRLQAESTIPPYEVFHPDGSGERIKVPICSVEGRAFVAVQDSKHALKTLRNNLFSGANCLVLGNFLASYRLVYALAFDPGAPLYHRDLVKLDRQDDNAAMRLFSSGALRFLVARYPERKGLIVYLFVFGELIDSIQSRHISHRTRLRMAWRAYFFLELWQRQLNRSDHPVNKHCISHLALDIVEMIVHGLIGLNVVFRDHLDGRRLPFLPWKFGSDHNERAFAEFRKKKPDFNAHEFKYMVGPIQQVMDYNCGMLKHDNPNATAAGYADTTQHDQAADLAVLQDVLEDDEIQTEADVAFHEAKNLMLYLGVNPSELSRSAPTSLPSFQSLLTGSNLPPQPLDLQDFDEVDDTGFDDDDPDIYELEIEQLIHFQEGQRGIHDQRFMVMKSSAASLLAEQQREL